MNASPITDPMLSIVRTLMKEKAAKGETFISLRLDIIAEMVARIDASEPSSDGVLQAYMNAKELCTDYDYGRGIWKRICENRELLLCLQEHGADFLERCCWVERFFYSQDVFLVSLVNALYLTKPVWMPPSFPRQWPGKEFDPSQSYLQFVPAIAESKGAPICEDSTGKDAAP